MKFLWERVKMKIIWFLFTSTLTTTMILILTWPRLSWTICLVSGRETLRKKKNETPIWKINHQWRRKDENKIPADRSRSRSPCWWARRRKLVFYPPKSTLHLKYLLLIIFRLCNCACFTRLSWLFPRATTRRSFSRSSTVGWEPIAIPSLKLVIFSQYFF